MTTCKQKQLFDASKIARSLLTCITNALDGGLADPAHDQYRLLLKETYEKKFFKKFPQGGSDSPSIKRATLRAFIANAKRLRSFNLDLPSSAFLSRRSSDPRFIEDRVLLMSREIFRGVLGSVPKLHALLENCRHTSGTTLGLSFLETNLEDKWKNVSYIHEDAKWIVSRYADVVGIQEGDYSFSRKSASRYAQVPKNDTINRSIFVEPTAEVFVAVSIMEYIFDRLSILGFDVDKQQVLHNRLAFSSSIHGRLATIDSTMASDSVTTDLIAWYSTLEWYNLLRTFRSERSLIKGIVCELPTFCTMGNPMTFALETLIFYSVAYASVLVTAEKTRSCIPDWDAIKRIRRSKTVSVFGDDVILPTENASLFVSVIERLGFIINLDKTCMDLPTKGNCFRESCGTDYLAGRNVRAFFISPPQSQNTSSLGPWLAQTFNGIQTKYISYFGTLNYVYYLGPVVEVMLEVIKDFDIKIMIVPDSYPDDSGFKVLSDPRLVRCFRSCLFKPIMVNASDQISFNYWRFRYTRVDRGHGLMINGHLRVREKLKTESWKPSNDRLSHIKNGRDTLSTYVNKKIGGYVTARALTYVGEITHIRRATYRLPSLYQLIGTSERRYNRVFSIRRSCSTPIPVDRRFPRSEKTRSRAPAK